MEIEFWMFGHNRRGNDIGVKNLQVMSTLDVVLEIISIPMKQRTSQA